MKSYFFGLIFILIFCLPSFSQVTPFVQGTYGVWEGEIELNDRKVAAYGNYSNPIGLQAGFEFGEDFTFSHLSGQAYIGYQWVGVPQRENSVIFGISAQYEYEVVADVFCALLRANIVTSTKETSGISFDAGFSTNPICNLSLEIFGRFNPEDAQSMPSRYYPPVSFNVSVVAFIGG